MSLLNIATEQVQAHLPLFTKTILGLGAVNALSCGLEKAAEALPSGHTGMAALIIDGTRGCLVLAQKLLDFFVAKRSK